MKNLFSLILASLLSACYTYSQTISWSGYPTGGTSYTSGIMTATVTSQNPGFQNSTPRHYAGATVGSGQCGIAGGLALEHLFGNITNAHSTLNLDFTSGNTTNGLCGNISFRIKDINSEESNQTFADWVEISAFDGNNNPIPVGNIVATGGTNKINITSGNTRIIKGHNNGSYGSRSTTTCDEMTFTVTPAAGTTLKNVVIKYHPDYTAAPNNYYSFMSPLRPAYQYISISPITVTPSAGPTAMDIAVTPASCVGNDGEVSIESVTGGTAPYQYNFNNQGLSGTTDYAGLASGTYPVLVQDNNGCTYSTTANVTQQTGPTAVVATPTNATCGQTNGSVVLGNVTGGTAPYEFNFNNQGFSTTTTYSGLGSGTYTIVVSDANDCTYSTTVNVGSSSSPTAVVATPTNATCGQTNGSVVLGAVTGGTGPYEFNFNSQGFSTTTTYSGLGSGIYTIVVSDVNNCTYSTTVAVTATGSGPTNIVITPTDETCGQTNGSVVLGTVTGGTGPYEFNFNNQGFSTTTTYSGLGSGTYTVVVSDVNNCTYSTTATIASTGNGPTGIVITPTDETCGQTNGSVVLGTVTGGTAPYQYNFNNQGFSTTTTYSGLGNGTFTIVVRDANNCLYNTTVNISSVGGPTNVVITPTNEMCGQANGSVVFGTVTGGVGPYEFNFNNQGFSTTTTYSGLATGTYTIVVHDVNDCPYNTTVNIGSTGGPTNVVITPTDAACGQTNGSVVLGTVTGGTGPYEFNFNNQGFSTTTTYSGLGSSTYTIVIHDVNDCPYTTTVNIGSVGGPTNVVITPANEMCGQANGSVVLGTVTGGTGPYEFNFNNQGFSTTTTYSGLGGGTYTIVVNDVNDCLYNTTVNIGSTGGPTNIVVTPTDAMCGQTNGNVVLGTVAGGTGPYEFNFNNQGFSTTTTYSGLGSGMYTIVVHDVNDCPYTTTVNIGSIGGPTNVVVTPANETCGQSNGSVVLGTVTGGTGPYEFNFNSQGFSTATTYSGLGSGTYTIVVHDVNDCPYTTTVNIGSIGGPTNIVLIPTNATCGQANGNVVLGNVTGGTSPYEFNFNNQGFSTTTTYSDLGSGTYTIIVNDANDCSYSTTITIQQSSQAIDDVDYTTIEQTCSSNGLFIITDVIGGAAPYVYTLNGVTVTDTITNVTSGVYNLEITDINGCVLDTLLTMPEGLGEETLHIPNVFTPNADKANDVWFISGTCIQDIECVIVNRWGEVMATLEHYTDVWDGYFKGKLATPGVYFYKAKVTFGSGVEEIYHGHITLVD
jgi:gliding motility-associated-like protein